MNSDTSKTEITRIMNEIDENVTYFNEVAQNVIDSYASNLDKIMANVERDIINTEYPSTDILEKYLLELTFALYKDCDSSERLGVYDDVSKASAKEVYNTAYLDSQSTLVNNKKPTVGESTAVAEATSLYNTTVSSIYSRCYKAFKFKIDAAQEMVKSISKIISKRMNEQTSLPDVSGSRLLNEEYI